MNRPGERAQRPRGRLIQRWLKHHLDVEPSERIFVNRSLRMDSIAAVGFDMDHTLAIYRSEPFEALAFEKAREKLVRKWGYGRRVLGLRYQKDFVIRGLVVDKRHGNILKMDRHRYVTSACHGTRPLPDEVRKRMYSNRRIRLSGSSYSVIDTLFSLPEISLYAQMVDLVDEAVRAPKDYRRLYEHVRDCVDEAHADGSIKRVITQNPARFLELDAELPEVLQQMRAHGKRLFLLTNSEPDYTDVVMSHLLSGRLPRMAHWTDYFDAVVVRAGKPAFFVRRAPFDRPQDPRLKLPPRSRRKVVVGGSVHQLERLVGVRGDRVLYFGDHTYGDILKSKHSSGWRTAMIIQDLEPDLVRGRTTAPQMRRLLLLERQRDRLVGWHDFLLRSREGRMGRKLAAAILGRLEISDGGPRHDLDEHLEVLRAALRSLQEEIDRLEEELKRAFNPHWGSIFRAGREASHFGAQVRSFACIYTCRVSNFLNYPMSKFFQAPHEILPHEQLGG